MQTSTPDGSGENKWFLGWKPFNVLCPADQTFMLTAVETGGAAKIKNFFCPYCVNQLEEIDTANNTLSLTDEEKAFPFPDIQWECLHHEVISEGLMSRL